MFCGSTGASFAVRIPGGTEIYTRIDQTSSPKGRESIVGVKTHDVEPECLDVLPFFASTLVGRPDAKEFVLAKPAFEALRLDAAPTPLATLEAADDAGFQVGQTGR